MINRYKLKLTRLQEEILRLLFIKAGTSLNARRIALLLYVSQPAVSKALPLLEKEELITVSKDKDSKRLSIELKRDNHEVIWLKRADNLKQIYESGLSQWLYDNLPSATVILFGSYALGEDTLDSDIDLAIIGKEKALNLDEFEKILERKININYYKGLKEKDTFLLNKFLLNNILNGITLKGTVEL